MAKAPAPAIPPFVAYVSQTLQYKRKGVELPDAAIVTRVLEDGRVSLTVFGENLSDYDSPVTIFATETDGAMSGQNRYAFLAPYAE